MEHNDNYSPLPFFRDIRAQLHRQPYAYGAVYPLLVPAGRLIPFQIQKAGGGAAVKAEVLTLGGTAAADITERLAAGGMTLWRADGGGKEIVVYPALKDFSEPLPEGRYYVRLTDEAGTVWFSEVFTSVSGVPDCLTVEWWDDADMMADGGAMIYASVPYRNRVYLRSDVGKPGYEFEEEGEERDGYFFPEKRMSEKTYKFVFLAPEYLCDAMRLAPLSDHVAVRDRLGRAYSCDTFSIAPKWEAQGDLAAVEAEFQTCTVVKKAGMAAGAPASPDFRNDFDNDFKT